MKTLKLISALLLLSALLIVSVRCSNNDPAPTPTPLLVVSGNVTYTNAAGTSANAPGAVVSLISSTETLTAVTDANGKYHFSNVLTGSYTLTSTYFTDNKNISGRLDGLTFNTFEPVAVEVAAADVVKDLTLTSAGQTGIEILDANYVWDTPTSKYVNTGSWLFDGAHSPINFEFPYRDNDADFNGGFSQLSKAVITFNPDNLAASSINVEVDVASINTRAPGGRDNTTTNMVNPVFSPITSFIKLGCIMGTFGITADGGTPTDVAPLPITTNTKRYAQFVSTSIEKLGDGYVAKGNLTFLGITKATDIWFKGVPSWTDASNNRRYAGFEGRFIMNAKADYGVTSSSVNDAALKIQISIVLYKQL